MSLSGNDDDVAGHSAPHCKTDRLATIGDQLIILSALRSGPVEAGLDLGDDRKRVLTARVIGRNNGKIAGTRGHFTHHRAFRTVPIAAATKHDDHPAFGKFASSPEHIVESV